MIEGFNTDSYQIFTEGTRYEFSLKNGDSLTGKFQGANRLDNSYIIVVLDDEGTIHNLVSGELSRWSEIRKVTKN